MHRDLKPENIMIKVEGKTSEDGPHQGGGSYKKDSEVKKCSFLLQFAEYEALFFCLLFK